MTTNPISLRTELRETLKLAGPIVLSQVGNMSMGLVDTLVAGHISTTALAGLGLAANVFWTSTSVFIGCLLALDTFFAQSVGAKDERGLTHYFAQAIWLCGFVTMASAVLTLGGASLYLHMTTPNSMKEAFGDYVFTVTWSLPGVFVFFLLQRYWQARHRVVPFTIIMLVANVLNFAGCLAFGLGMWSFPKLGIAGIAWSTVISRYSMLVVAAAYTWFELKPASLRFPKINWVIQRRFLALGLPAAGHAALEIGAFAIATVLVSILGPIQLAANHVCLMMASFTFMFPLGFSSAAAVRVGTAVGAQQPNRARMAGWLCIGTSVCVMGGFALIYLLFARQLLQAFTSDPAVIELGSKILILVALFQIADGTQVSTTGALRGLGNTRAAMIANLIGHYPIGLTLGLCLCFVAGYGTVGLWTGLAVGLVSVAAILLFVWTRATRSAAAFQPILAHTDMSHPFK
jgi:MATE family multidrug resistance protein